MPTSDSGDNGNGKVTMAVIGAKLDGLDTVVREFYARFLEDHDKLTQVCTKFEDIDTIKKGLLGEGVALLVTAIIAVLALLGKF